MSQKLLLLKNNIKWAKKTENRSSSYHLWCYKVVFGLVDTDVNDFFKFNTRTTSRGHRYKLYKERAITGTRSHFFSERVINAWNSLPTELDFTSLNRFRRAIVNVDFSASTKCF